MVPRVVVKWANRLSPVLLTSRHGRRNFRDDVRFTNAAA
jgi:hypothetical protein